MMSPAKMIEVRALDEMPQILRDQIIELEAWADSNRKDARNDAIRFWILKIPAIIISACAGIFAYFRLEAAAVIASGVASVCVLIDGLNPGGALRNSHHKALHDLRRLQHKMQAQWRIEAWALDKNGTEELASKIIKDAQNEIDRVAAYLRDAESMLGAKHE